MSSALVHIIQSNAIVIVGFLLYLFLLKRTAMHQFNRAYLLALPLIALVLPSLNFSLPAIGAFTIQLPEVLTQNTGPQASQVGSNFSWLALIWSLGALIRLSITVRGFIHIRDRFRQGDARSFTFLRQVHIEEGLNEAESEKIKLHESVHARQLHSLDLAFLELWRVVFWFNPAFSLIQSSLKEIHEYIADKEADSQTVGYSELLLAHAFGLSELPLANEFHNSKIKNRIMMIDQKIKSSAKFNAAGALLVLLSLGICIACTSPTADAGTDPVHEKVDQMPAFSGCDTDALKGEALKSCSMEKLFAYVSSSFTYPKEEEKKGVEGKVMVEFVVSKKGDVEQAKVVEQVSPALDAAALQLVQGMPQWSPGVQDGKKVNVKMTLPVMFKLTD